VTKARWKRIDLTERQARRWYARLVALEHEAAQYAEIAGIQRRMSPTRELDHAELRRRLILAGLNPRDRWPQE
jgi:hypothetical protein